MKSRKLPLGGSSPRRPRTESSDQAEGLQTSRSGGGVNVNSAAATGTSDSNSAKNSPKASPVATDVVMATEDSSGKASQGSARSVKKSQSPPEVGANTSFCVDSKFESSSSSSAKKPPPPSHPSVEVTATTLTSNGPANPPEMEESSEDEPPADAIEALTALATDVISGGGSTITDNTTPAATTATNGEASEKKKNNNVSASEAQKSGSADDKPTSVKKRNGGSISHASSSDMKEKKVDSSSSKSTNASTTGPPILTTPGSKRALSFDATTPPLTAMFKGRKHKVTIKINGSVYNPNARRGGGGGGARTKSSSASSATVGLGFDGNQFYCQVCGGFGDVVCCDGCPKVYHAKCIPPEDPSAMSLQANDDPWYCPSCFQNPPSTTRRTPSGKKKRSAHATPSSGRRGGDGNNHHMTPSSAATSANASTSSASTSTPSRRTTSQNQCVDCHETLDGVGMEPCQECGNYVHHPSCREEVAMAYSFSPKNHDRVLCSTCFAVDSNFHAEEADFEAKEAGASHRKHSKGKLKSIPEGEDEEMDGDYPMDDVEVEANSSKDVPQGRAKRRKLSTGDEVAVPSSSKKSTSEKKRKKRKKVKSSSQAKDPPPGSSTGEHATKGSSGGGRKSASAAGGGGSGASASAGGSPLPVIAARTGPPTLAQATPAFIFYLTENRWKIETILQRKNRAFQRITKGGERNAMVAKEAAVWWSKLRPAEHKRYVNMSMRDFERRIIEWKEDKNIREMNDDRGHHVGEASVSGAAGIPEPGQEEGDDDQLTRDRHARLYLGTSVGSKPFKPESDQSYNRVLLDFLHDMRFHPLPMFSVNRPEDDTVKDDAGSKVTIPYFDVHGPISTSVGDECLGCLRGWTHSCPVLKRRIPAIEHRAKLQPPLSSLVATRVGLGLRPRLERKRSASDETPSPELHGWAESEETKELKEMKILPSCSLSEPNERMDDIVHFVEETIAMKVPEPPRPPENPDKGKKTQGIRTLPTQRQKEEDTASTGPIMNKCGRCRTIIQSDTGCVQCRRAQLVINMAKRQKQEGKSLKAHATMLGRVNMKEIIEIQPPGDQAFANAILKERWAPSVILPPRTGMAPGPKQEFATRPQQRTDFSEEDESSQDSLTGTDRSSRDKTPDLMRPHPDVEADGDTERRPRSTRVASVATESFEPAERQAILEKNRKQVNALHKKTVFITCCGMLHALLRRDPLLLFASPVTAESYLSIISKPIDFSIIRANVLAQNYQSVNAFANDVRLLCENALIYNPPGSIYAKTATELQQVLGVMQKRASKWISAIKDAYASYLSRNEFRRRKRASSGMADDEASEEAEGDPFEELREQWPEAVEMLDHGDWLQQQIAADFMRTRENELAYYGSLAVRRVAVAAEASLAPYTDTSGMHSVVATRSHIEDEQLRNHIDKKVTESVGPIELKDPSTWREESVHRLLRKVQSRRLDKVTASEQGCARCDGLVLEQDVKIGMKADAALGKTRKSEENDTQPRVHASRMKLTTGLASAKTRQGIAEREKESVEAQYDSVKDACVSVRGSKIHGWGLFADQEFREGAVVTEYVGEYIGNATADAREKLYQEQRIQDYLFRVDGKLVIDATMKGGHGRYANHNCSPNCFTKIIPGKEPKPHLKRVMIIALRKIQINEEITYDYQFPLELDLHARIPCNCQSDSCRGFMNWDLPEKGSNNRAILVQKRGANMRDRIRRLGRPLKRDEV